MKFSKLYYSVLTACLLLSNTFIVHAQPAVAVKEIDNSGHNSYYISNKAPLMHQYFIKLPVKAIKPAGWLRKQLDLERTGLMGNLGEISVWLSKKDNAWINKSGKGKYGWEELPYWLKGYGDVAYMLDDPKMLKETNFWIQTVISNQRPNGDFGPLNYTKPGRRDLWGNMPMLWCLQSYYEYSKDPKVLNLMTKYFKYEMSIPDSLFLKDYWENSRGGDNLISVYWLYNRTGAKWLLGLASKIDRNTANWRQANNLPNWHNVNIAQSFREPATYYMQSDKPADLHATYNDFNLVRDIYGQVPGGMFGADENARKGYTDPRQAVETCGMVEQMTSDEFLIRFTGDTFWADNCEDVAFNTFPAAFTPDYRGLRYLTAPNMVVSDSKNHAPGIDNDGPFLNMNPFSSRCCQHNHSAGWVYYAENSWMATPDNGLADQLYSAGTVTARAGNGHTVTIVTTTHYPFDDEISLEIHTAAANKFPLYLRIPKWCNGASLQVNGKPVAISTNGAEYIRLANTWKNGDRITLHLPMTIQVREWTRNKNSVSVNYGPLTFSLRIDEKYVKVPTTRANSVDDAKWQPTADPTKWPTYEIYPASAWNYALMLDKDDLAASFTVEKRPWPKNNDPFTDASAPVILKAKGRIIPGWKIDQYGLCGLLPQSPVKTDEPQTDITLVPMGGARLRISAFPVAE
ncbi:MAG TPA: beta-L-arabinofuranosidase domain-containing protein [Mucilaginibacter sp.]|nr:beta-L-arabinofuranosidase domain-containing protein [Mucilaginibacter sp.]